MTNVSGLFFFRPRGFNKKFQYRLCVITTDIVKEMYCSSNLNIKKRRSQLERFQESKLSIAQHYNTQCLLLFKYQHSKENL